MGLEDDIRDIIRKFEEMDLRYSGGRLDLPEGVSALHPTGCSQKVKKSAESILTGHQGKAVSDSVFKPTEFVMDIYSPENLSPIYKEVDIIISSQKIPSEYSLSDKEKERVARYRSEKGYMNIISGDIVENSIGSIPASKTSPTTKSYQESYLLGTPLLNYFPYGVDFSGTMVRIRNLHTGTIREGYKFPVELDGFHNKKACPSVDISNLPEKMWFCNQTGTEERSIIFEEKPIIRNIPPRSLRESETVWYYPFYEVPVSSNRAVKKRKAVLYIDKKKLTPFNFKMDIVEQSFPFVSRGAIFYDGISCNEVDRVYSHSDFLYEDGSKNPKHDIRVIRTIDLFQDPPQANIYNPRNISPPYFSDNSEMWNPDLKLWALIGGSFGALPGVWEGQSWIYLSTALSAGIAVSGAYIWSSWSNEDKLKKMEERQKKEMNDFEAKKYHEQKKKTESIEDIRKKIISLLEAPQGYYNRYSDSDIWSNTREDVGHNTIYGER